MVPKTSSGTRLTYSMMSISPVCGHPTWLMSVPRLQKAGQRPSSPGGTWMRDSMRPYANSALFAERSRAEV